MDWFEITASYDSWPAMFYTMFWSLLKRPFIFSSFYIVHLKSYFILSICPSICLYTSFLFPSFHHAPFFYHFTKPSVVNPSFPLAPFLGSFFRSYPTPHHCLILNVSSIFPSVFPSNIAVIIITLHHIIFSPHPFCLSFLFFFPFISFPPSPSPHFDWPNASYIPVMSIYLV